jgi:hypothetical protein
VFNDFYVRHDIDNQGLDATQKSNATTNIGAQSILEKGQIDGYASLDGTGRVPSSQLPSFVDDVLEFPTLGDFPETGESGKIYIALDTNKTYRWGGTTYVEISAGVVLGETETTAYRGDRGKIAYDYSQIGHLPLTGGTLASSGSTNTLNIDHASGSGLALNITKAGNDEGLKVVKTSGSGLAASITGGVTLLDELNLTTKLADAHIASADTWNAKIGGTIAAGQVAFGTAAGVIGGDAGLTWDNVNKRLGVGTSAPASPLEIVGQSALRGNVRIGNNALNTTIFFNRTDGLDLMFARIITNGQIQIGGANVGIISYNNSSGEMMRMNGGSLLIGTNTNAGFRLDVNGTARIVGATRIDNLAGTGTRMVVADANGVMSTQALGIAGSGTLNRLAKFTAAGTVGDSQVFDNGTNVGIGTDSPVQKLDVNGSINSIEYRVNNIPALLHAGVYTVIRDQSDGNRLLLGNTSDPVNYYDNDEHLFRNRGGSVIRLRIKESGNLLINADTDAGFKLDVNGTGRFTGDLKADTRIGVGVSPLHDIHISKAGQDTAIVTEVTSTNRAATNNSLSNVAGVSIAAFGSTYPESGGSRWAGRAGVYINTGKPNQTYNVWIGNKTIMNSLNTGWTAIGQNDPIAFFHVQGSAVVDGSMSANSYITTSDKRKKDIISQDGELATYQFKGDDKIHYGYIAQDMEDLYPNQVSTDNDGMLSLNYIEILVKKVHDLEKEIQLLKNK